MIKVAESKIAKEDKKTLLESRRKGRLVSAIRQRTFIKTPAGQRKSRIRSFSPDDIFFPDNRACSENG